MFTPVEAAIGALLIQASTTLYLLLTGKTIGFSSIIYNAVVNRSLQHLAVSLGLLLSSLFVYTQLPAFLPAPFASQPHTTTVLSNDQVHRLSSLVGASAADNAAHFVTRITSQDGGLLRHILAGTLVGLGTSWGCGCTSGHMLAGLSRLRLRSIVATAIFVSVAIAVVTALGLGQPCHDTSSNDSSATTVPCYRYDTTFAAFRETKPTLYALLAYAFASSYVVLPALSSYTTAHQPLSRNTVDPSSTTLSAAATARNTVPVKVLRFLAGVNAGFVFGAGLFVSGMVRPEKTIGFLAILTPDKFDPSLAMIIVFCILPNIFLWNTFLPRDASSSTSGEKLPLLEDKYFLSYSGSVPLSFILGHLLFGLGWGLLGVCPGPGLVSVVFNGADGIAWLVSFVAAYGFAKKVSS